MKVTITKRANKRIADSRRYLENEFYPEYGRNIDQPDVGHEAFPEIKRPDLRKILCIHYSYWTYYRRKMAACEILPVRHTLMNIESPRQL